jgi:hypothetical protein
VFAPSPAHALLANLSAATSARLGSGIVRATAAMPPTPTRLFRPAAAHNADTYFNWGVYQNPAVIGTWHDEFFLDDN